MDDLTPKQVEYLDKHTRYMDKMELGEKVQEIIEEINNDSEQFSPIDHNHDSEYSSIDHNHEESNSDIVTLINKTGGISVKGTVVAASSTVDLAVSKIVVNEPDPIGVILEDGINDGQPVKVVKSGIAEVLFIGNTTRKHLARGFITGDNGYISGYALSEAIPTSPFATDKHFYEIGHILESKNGPGLAKVMLHFN